MKVEIPEAFEFLFHPGRAKILYGGRGGAKSWNIARVLILQGAQEPHRILCAREMQKSIKDSVHKLISDQIYAMGLQDFYEIQKATIIGKNGTEFIFDGISNKPQEIKSLEGLTRVWLEEAANVSKESYEALIPTIRRDNSELWVSFNPQDEMDETYQRWVVNPPDYAIVKKVSWRDNPYFPDVLRREMEELA